MFCAILLGYFVTDIHLSTMILHALSLHINYFQICNAHFYSLAIVQSEILTFSAKVRDYNLLSPTNLIIAM